MIRAISIATFTMLIVAANAGADVPLPKDLKYVDPRVRFGGVDKYADHSFFLRFKTFSGGPANTPFTTIEVKDAKDFNLKAQRRIFDMHLLAIERKDFEQRKKDDPSMAWLTDKTAGILSAKVPTPSTTASVKLKETPITTYNVTLKDGKLAVTMQPTKTSDATPFGPMPLWVFALAFALSLASFGVWVARRKSA